jgi:hypothetical protein
LQNEPAYHVYKLRSSSSGTRLGLVSGKSVSMPMVVHTSMRAFFGLR